MDLSAYVSVQPPDVFYRQHGVMVVEFTNERITPQQYKWTNSELQLVYETYEPVQPHRPGTVFQVKRFGTSANGTILRYELYINEISRNHLSRPFRLHLRTGDGGHTVCGPGCVGGGLTLGTNTFMVRMKA